VTNYSVDSRTNNATGRTATFATNSAPQYVDTVLNDGILYIFSVARNADLINFWRLTSPNTISGSQANNTTRANFTTGSFPLACQFIYNGANSYLVSADNSGNTVSFWRFNADTLTGTVAVVSRTATFAASTGPRHVFMELVSSSVARLIIPCGGTGNTVHFYEFDPSTVSGSINSGSGGIRYASFAGGSAPHWASYVRTSSTQAYLAIAARSSAQIDLYAFNPTTVSGATAATLRQAIFQVGSNPQVVYLNINGSNSYLISADNGSNLCSLHKFNIATVTGTVTTASRITIACQGSLSAMGVYPNGSKTLLFVGDGGASTPAAGLYILDPTTISSNRTLASRDCSFAVGNDPAGISFVENGANSYLTLVGLSSDNLSFHRGDINQRTLQIALSSSFFVNGSTPIFKVSGGTLTLNTSLDYFSASLYLRAGSQITSSGVGTAVFPFGFTADSDTTGTITENFILSGATAGITGNYRLTMGASTTLTLGNKGTYNDSFTVPGTGTLVITQNTILGSSFILSAGTTVNKSGAGTMTLTIPYADPGLILGSGVILNSPTISISFIGLPSGTEARITQGSKTIDYLANVTSGIYSFSYTSLVGEKVQISFNNPGFIQYRETFTLSATSQTIPLIFQPDPSYV